MLRRHDHFPCNDTTAERWLHHSQIAFEQVRFTGHRGGLGRVAVPRVSLPHSRLPRGGSLPAGS